MVQPQTYIMSDKEHLICKFKKSLYDLKQAPRQWYLKLDRFMANSGYSRLQADHCCYFKYCENSYIIPLLYVDDILVVDSNMKEIVNLKAHLVRKFSMKKLGPAKKIHGMRINKEMEKKIVEAITSRVHCEAAQEV